MNEKDMKSVLQNAVDHRLSGLKGNPFLAQRIMASEKGDQPIVKKKFSVSLIAVLIVMMLTLSIACALVESRIANEMYGNEAVPQDVADCIQMLEENTASDLGMLTLDELLYDGRALHTSFTIANTTDETLLYTVDGLWLNGMPLTRSTLLTEGAGTCGVLLGGSVDGNAMPASRSIYNMGDALYLYDGNSKYQGQGELPEGEANFKLAVAVWRPVNQPQMVDYSDYEGVNVTETADHLVTDVSGYADLELFRPEACYRNTAANQRSSEVYADTFKTLGWAELVDCMEVEVPVTLDISQLPHVVPAQTEYDVDGLKLTITEFHLTHAGGSMEGWINGDADVVKAFLKDGVYLADREGNRVLNNGCWWDDQPAENGGVHFTLKFDPVAGEFPEVVELAPFAAHDPRWDERSVSYNPAVEKPENVVGAYQLDFTRAIRMELKRN